MNRKTYKKPKIWIVSLEVTGVLRTSGDTIIEDFDIVFVE